MKQLTYLIEFENTGKKTYCMRFLFFSGYRLLGRGWFLTRTYAFITNIDRTKRQLYLINKPFIHDCDTKWKKTESDNIYTKNSFRFEMINDK